MKIAVIGSRDFEDYALLESKLNTLENITSIISGGAKGADSLAEQYALQHSIDVVVIKPDWKRYNRGAGLVRNKEIVDMADLVVAFWNGKSKGTLDVIEYSKKQTVKLITVLT